MTFSVTVIVLLWADVFAVYLLWMTMEYFTDVWKLHLTHAAAILNFWSGLGLVLPLLFSHIVDAFFGNFKMLLLSSLTYCGGMGMLWMSTPPVFAKFSGDYCSDYEPECIGSGHRVLFYVGLAFAAVGKAGHSTSLESFASEQSESDEDQIKGCRLCLGVFAAILTPIVGIIVIAIVGSWSVRYGIAALVNFIALLIFVSGVRSYRYVRPRGSPHTTIFRVFVAAASKVFHRSTPQNGSNRLYENGVPGQDKMLPHTPGLRCLDKAALIPPNRGRDQQETNRWKLCSVTEVEETKIAVRMIPVWLTFVICGIVSSVGNTYFAEQAKNLSRKVGRLTISPVILLAFYDSGWTIFGDWYFQFFRCFRGSHARRNISRAGVATAMVFSILCCITAAKVESRRLNVVTSHDLINKPDDKIPLTLFWLVPQFILLGALDGIFKKSMAYFFVDQVPPSFEAYLVNFSNAVVGGGFMCSALSVYAVGRITGKLGWFQSTLNKSRLDNYYWVLAVLSSVNLIAYVIIAFCYAYRDSGSEEPEDQVEWEPGMNRFLQMVELEKS